MKPQTPQHQEKMWFVQEWHIPVETTSLSGWLQHLAETLRAGQGMRGWSGHHYDGMTFQEAPEE